jgi:hypothetical protein
LGEQQYAGAGVGSADADVMEASGVAQGEFSELVDAVGAVDIFRRWGLTVEVNPWAGDGFKANQLIVRAETRFGVGCIYPKAVCKVTGLSPSS